MLHVERILSCSLFGANETNILIACKRISEFKPNVGVIQCDVDKTHTCSADAVLNLVDRDTYVWIGIYSIRVKSSTSNRGREDIGISFIELPALVKWLD